MLYETEMILDSSYTEDFIKLLAMNCKLDFIDVQRQNNEMYDDYLSSVSVSLDTKNDGIIDLKSEYSFINSFKKDFIRGDLNQLVHWNSLISKCKLNDQSIIYFCKRHMELFLRNPRKCLEKVFSDLKFNIIENNGNSLLANINMMEFVNGFVPSVFVDKSSSMKPKVYSCFCNIHSSYEIDFFLNIDLGKSNFSLEYLKVRPVEDSFSKYDLNLLELYNLVLTSIMFKKFCSELVIFRRSNCAG